jgi:hypothetical protein
VGSVMKQEIVNKRLAIRHWAEIFTAD